MKHETYVTNTMLVFRGLAAVALVDLILTIFPSSGRSRRVLIRPETDSAEEQLMILVLLVAVGLFWWGAGPLARWCWRGTGSTPAPGTPAAKAWTVAGASFAGLLLLASAVVQGARLAAAAVLENLMGGPSPVGLSLAQRVSDQLGGLAVLLLLGGLLLFWNRAVGILLLRLALRGSPENRPLRP